MPSIPPWALKNRDRNPIPLDSNSSSCNIFFNNQLIIQFLCNFFIFFFIKLILINLSILKIIIIIKRKKNRNKLYINCLDVFIIIIKRETRINCNFLALPHRWERIYIVYMNRTLKHPRVYIYLNINIPNNNEQKQQQQLFFFSRPKSLGIASHRCDASHTHTHTPSR